MTIVTNGSDEVVEQITKHLNRLVDVVKVVDLSEGPHIERELMLIKLRAVGKERDEMTRMADIIRGRIIDVPGIGQATCRDRVGQEAWMQGDGCTLKKKE